MLKNVLSSALIIVSLCFFTGCTRVPPGEVGILVNNYGNQKGVEDFPLQTGRVWYNPFTQDLYVYPTYMQSKAWTADKTEDSPKDESITFNSVEGSSITVDVGLNYTLDPEKVPGLFIEFRQDINTITETYLRNQVRDALGRVGGKYKAIDIFGERKQELLEAVKEDLIEKLKSKGFNIDTLSFVSAPVADQRVMQSINMVIEATQKAVEAENKVKQVEAEAKQKIAEAEGKAQSILVEAKAQAEANQIIAASITPDLVRYKMLEKWSGNMPKVLGNSDIMTMVDLKEE